MEGKINVKYKLLAITDEHCFSKFDDQDLTGLNGGTLKFQYKINTIIKMSEDAILVIPGVKFSFADKVVFEESAVFNYSIPNLDGIVVVDKENQRINVKADIFPSLIGTAYNSLRGIVYMRTIGTPLAAYPVPMIEVNTLVEKNGISVSEGA
ncbi:MAG: hypothetical protein LKI59_05575 [Bacteroidales bacterium]|jgi:hypothetical protein|nr:hypothetical protein [Bacteroidales bacterium]